MIQPEVQLASVKFSANPRKYGDLAFQALCKLANSGNQEAKNELQRITTK
jgi:hypothetical protein